MNRTLQKKRSAGYLKKHMEEQGLNRDFLLKEAQKKKRAR
jgi:hypothetical protein